MATDARGIINEGDEFALHEASAGGGHSRAEQGVSLPGFIGVAFGKGQAQLVGGVLIGQQ